MTQEQRLDELLTYLLAECGGRLPAALEGITEKKQLFRALMNLRPPRPASPEFMALQDAYLQEEIVSQGIVDAAQLPPTPRGTRIVLWQGDITQLKVDGIVNAANIDLLGCFVPLHSCIDNIIHTKSGVALRLKCAELMRAQGHAEPTGSAKITPGYNLPCQYVLHTVGPIVQSRLTPEHCAQLAACYRACLELAARRGLKSLAFCCISTGVFRFPNERAAQIAIETVQNFLAEDQRLEKVIFNVYKSIDLAIYQKLLGIH